MFTQLGQLEQCHSPVVGEDVVLRPEFWSEYRDLRSPFVSAGGVEHI